AGEARDGLLISSLLPRWKGLRKRRAARARITDIEEERGMNLTPESDQIPPAPDVRLYKLPKSYLIISLLGVVLFAAATIGGIALPLANPDGSFARPVLAAIISGLFFCCLMLLCIYLLVACLYERLYVSSAAVRIAGVFRTKTVIFAEVTRAVWRFWPRGGSIVLHTDEGRLVIGFANYEGRRELAAFIRATLPADVQTDYDRYESTNVPGSEAFQRLRERNQRTAIWMQPVCGLGLIALAIWDP